MKVTRVQIRNVRHGTTKSDRLGGGTGGGNESISRMWRKREDGFQAKMESEMPAGKALWRSLWQGELVHHQELRREASAGDGLGIVN